VASAHTVLQSSHLAHELSSTKCFSKKCHTALNSSSTVEGWVARGKHTRVAYCQPGSHAVRGSYYLEGYFYPSSVHVGPTPEYDGTQLDFESYGSTYYRVTTYCNP
jgi:hypothetical protein